MIKNARTKKQPWEVFTEGKAAVDPVRLLGGGGGGAGKKQKRGEGDRGESMRCGRLVVQLVVWLSTESQKQF